MMEFEFNVNDVLTKEITLVVNRDLLHTSNKNPVYHERCKYGQSDIRRHNLAKIIDTLGACSSTAQNLRGAITTSFKLKTSEDHLYLLKESCGNNGFGEVVGIIRVGKKRLFLSDIYGQTHECVPLSVLDFYVHESKQRCGYGKKLFHHMLKSENLEAHELAIDRPSPKFINFLLKHYELDKPIYQVNKFVVFQSFFNDLEAVGAVDASRRRSAPMQRNNQIPKLSRPDSRNSRSAYSNRRFNNGFSSGSRTDKLVSVALNNLSKVPPLRNENISHLPPLDSSKNNGNVIKGDAQRDQGRPVQRMENRAPRIPSAKNNNYSRHFIKPDTVGSPSMTRQQHVPKASLDTRNHLTSQNYTVTHSRVHQANRNITSVDNPFSESKSLPQRTSAGEEDASYTMGLIDQFHTNRTSFGTSWNVFGVPTSMHHTNPYSKLQRKNAP